MFTKSTLANRCFSELEKKCAELTKLQKENLDLMFEIETTRRKVLEAKFIAEIEAKVYSGVKKLFK